MKILVITDKLYPDEVGGSCIVAYETIQEWQKNNIVDIFTCQVTTSSNDKLFSGKVIRQFIKRNPMQSSRQLKKLLEKKQYDIVVTHSVFSWMIFYLATLKKNKKIKCVSVFHGPWHKEAYLRYKGENKNLKSFFYPKIMWMIEKLYCKNNQYYIFLSQYMKEQLRSVDKCIDNRNIYYIPGGVHIDKFTRNYDKKQAKKELGLEEEKIVLFTLRRLDKRMGIDYAIKAMGMLPKEKRKQFVLVIGGKGSYYNNLKKEAEKVDANIIFAGFIPDEELNKYFCATDLFVVPTLDLEGFGLVNLESLAMGVPVLATPQGGMLELKSKFENFYLCKDITPEDLSKGFVKYGCSNFNNIIYEPEIKNYSWENISNMYLEVFERIISNA